MTEDDKFIAHLAADLAANLVTTGALDLDIATRSVKIARMIVQQVERIDTNVRKNPPPPPDIGGIIQKGI